MFTCAGDAWSEPRAVGWDQAGLGGAGHQPFVPPKCAAENISDSFLKCISHVELPVLLLLPQL